MELTAEQINTFLSNAVLESQIGAVVKEAVARSVADLSKSYNNPFDSVIKAHITRLIDKEVIATYQPTLEQGIKDALAKAMTDEAIARIIEAGMEKLRSRY